MRKLTSVALAAALLLPTAACVDRRTDADSIYTQIQNMPGVSSTDLDYKASYESGRVFRLTVMLDREVTEPQATELGRTFVEQMNRKGMAGHKVDFRVRYPASKRQKSPALPQYSQALFEFGKADPPTNPSADDVADSITVWLTAVRSPVSQSVYLGQPTWGDTADSRNIAITLKPDATEAAARRLQQEHPALAEVTWQLSLAVGEVERPRTYAATPDPPSDDVRALWGDISRAVDPRYELSGSTRPPQDDDQAKTKIEIDLGPGANHEDEADTQRITRDVAALLPRFGYPTALYVWGPATNIELVVGGCYRHKDGHEPQPLEKELAKRYERC